MSHNIAQLVVFRGYQTLSYLRRCPTCLGTRRWYNPRLMEIGACPDCCGPDDGPPIALPVEWREAA